MADEIRKDGYRVSDSATVLIVDNDAGVRRVLDFILQEVEHCQVLTAADGETALQMVAIADPDMVLTEVRLPGISGAELAARIRASGHMDTRIVLMSAYPRPPLGAEDHFLYKPIRFERLLEIAGEVAAAHH